MGAGSSKEKTDKVVPFGQTQDRQQMSGNLLSKLGESTSEGQKPRIRPKDPTSSSSQQQAGKQEEQPSLTSALPPTGPVSLPRQEHLDSSIQSKIREELNRLKKQEDTVRQQIDAALEKESLDRASQSASKGAKGKSSILLRQELDDVRSKIERHTQRRQKVEKAPGVKEARNDVLKCYNDQPGRTLECWSQVQNFKDAVARAEKDFVASMAS